MPGTLEFLYLIQPARAIMNTYPAVQAGVMRARLFPYRIALMANRQGSAE